MRYRFTSSIEFGSPPLEWKGYKYNVLLLIKGGSPVEIDGLEDGEVVYLDIPTGEICQS